MFVHTITTTMSDPKKLRDEVERHRNAAKKALGEAAEIRASDLQHMVQTDDGQAIYRLVTQWHVPPQAGGVDRMARVAVDRKTCA